MFTGHKCNYLGHFGKQKNVLSNWETFITNMNCVTVLCTTVSGVPATETSIIIE